MTDSQSSPYDKESKKSFWKSGVAAVQLGKDLFSELHETDLITKSQRISSIGSCFAQHVGKWLNAEGYTFNQSKIETSQVASFAFGNVYTPRCLLQWFDTAKPVAKSNGSNGIYYHGNKFYDLLRPRFKPSGYESKASLIKDRNEAVDEMLETLATTDMFIITLGLTEAWKDCDGLFYPSCPGIIAGSFNSSKYSIYNFNSKEIRTDVEELVTRLKNINPNIKVILTVSPVPLTATATNKHIIVANQHSKSILRSVAGELSDEYPDINYFPSYEIITAPNRGDFRFESNLRTVTSEAVSYVMSHLEPSRNENHIQLEIEEIDDKGKESHLDIIESNDVICDEEMIQATAKLDQDIQQPFSTLTLFGDSHMAKLSTSLTLQNIHHCGGMVMNGSAFSKQKFGLCDTEYFVPLESPESRKLWSVILNNLKKHEEHRPAVNSTIITNVGMQTHQNIAKFVGWLNGVYPENKPVITIKELVDFFNDELAEQLSIVLKLHSNGHKIIIVSDPPFCKYFKESESMAHLIYSYFDAMEYVWGQFGVQFYNAARKFDEEISDPSLYLSTFKHSDGRSDWYHGNDKYYTWLAGKLVKQIQM